MNYEVINTPTNKIRRTNYEDYTVLYNIKVRYRFYANLLKLYIQKSKKTTKPCHNNGKALLIYCSPFIGRETDSVVESVSVEDVVEASVAGVLL